ncbi:unnamed protein product, partial [Ectocarpus sp. 4 AP-2014]
QGRSRRRRAVGEEGLRGRREVRAAERGRGAGGVRTGGCGSSRVAAADVADAVSAPTADAAAAAVFVGPGNAQSGTPMQHASEDESDSHGVHGKRPQRKGGYRHGRQYLGQDDR